MESNKSYDDIKVQQTDAIAKQQAKEYADRKRWAEQKDFKVGKKAPLRQPHKKRGRRNRKPCSKRITTTKPCNQKKKPYRSQVKQTHLRKEEQQESQNHRNN